MKLMIASDIHGSLFYAQKMIEQFIDESANRLILLGDLLYHGPRNPLPKDYKPAEVAELLNKYKEKIIAIKGNCDSEVDQMVLEFPMLQDHSHLLIDDHHLYLSHGHLFNPQTLPPLEEQSIFVSGHTHIYNIEEQDDIYLLNPGSISLPKNNNPSTYAIYEDHTLRIKTLDHKELKSIKLTS